MIDKEISCQDLASAVARYAVGVIEARGWWWSADEAREFLQAVFTEALAEIASNKTTLKKTRSGHAALFRKFAAAVASEDESNETDLCDDIAELLVKAKKVRRS